MEKILILGSKGMFGTALEQVFKEKKLNYLGLSRKELDITKKDELESKINEIKPGIIINSAAMLGIIDCEKNPKLAFDINTISVLNLAKHCKDRNITLVQISTNAIFDGEKGALYNELDVPNPQNVYGLTKHSAEVCVKNNLSSYYIMRLPKLFGPRRNNTLGFTDKILEKMKNKQELTIATDRFDTFTYTLPAARTLLSLLDNNSEFGIYHIANKGNISYYDFVLEFAKAINYPGKITQALDSDFPSLAPNPLRTGLESIKIDYMPFWKESLEEYILNEKIKV